MQSRRTRSATESVLKYARERIGAGHGLRIGAGWWFMSVPQFVLALEVVERSQESTRGHGNRGIPAPTTHSQSKLVDDVIEFFVGQYHF